MSEYSSKCMIIGLCGKAGSGKSTVAEQIANLGTSIRLSFASALKETLSIIFNIPIVHFYDTILKEQEVKVGGDMITPRALMQFVGTELFREQLTKKWPKIGNVWINNVRDQIVINKEAVSYIVIDDVRFEDEAEMIRDLGGIIIKVSREQLTYIFSHSSENQNIVCDFEIINNTTLEEIDHQLRGILKITQTDHFKHYCGLV